MGERERESEKGGKTKRVNVCQCVPQASLKNTLSSSPLRLSRLLSSSGLSAAAFAPDKKNLPRKDFAKTEIRFTIFRQDGRQSQPPWTPGQTVAEEGGAKTARKKQDFNKNKNHNKKRRGETFFRKKKWGTTHIHTLATHTSHTTAHTTFHTHFHTEACVAFSLVIDNGEEKEREEERECVQDLPSRKYITKKITYTVIGGIDEEHRETAYFFKEKKKRREDRETAV